jgi:hypothetical protein
MAPSQDKVVVKTENDIALRLVSHLYDKILNLGLLGSCFADPDPHQSEKPDPHQSQLWDRACASKI